MGLSEIVACNFRPKLPARTIHLLAQVDGVATPISWPDRYPTLFTGLGTFQGDYEIQLKLDAKPFSLFTCCNVPLPMRKKVEEELARMESLGIIISKIEEPTVWCAGMVVVPKKSGSVRIYIDFWQLNECAQRSILCQQSMRHWHTSGARALMLMWGLANSIGRELQTFITTFITPFGRYHFKQATIQYQ